VPGGRCDHGGAAPQTADIHLKGGITMAKKAKKAAKKAAKKTAKKR
jgi:hypothetical protein